MREQQRGGQNWTRTVGVCIGVYAALRVLEHVMRVNSVSAGQAILASDINAHVAQTNTNTSNISTNTNNISTLQSQVSSLQSGNFSSLNVSGNIQCNSLNCSGNASTGSLSCSSLNSSGNVNSGSGVYQHSGSNILDASSGSTFLVSGGSKAFISVSGGTKASVDSSGQIRCSGPDLIFNTSP